MRRVFNPFVVVFTTILGSTYVYLAWRLVNGALPRLALAAPFLCIWLVPIVYWLNDRESHNRADELFHLASYVSMGWLNFAVLLSLCRDGLLLAMSQLGTGGVFYDFLHDSGAPWVLAASCLALGIGMLSAFRGPHVHRVDVPIAGLHHDLDGFRIVQISDLHIGPTIRSLYVRRVVRIANELDADVVALTGDIVDGPVARLSEHAAQLGALQPPDRLYLVLGNHDYYSGAGPWIDYFRSLGIQVLLNEYVEIYKGTARVVIGGTVDPAAEHYEPKSTPRPDLAIPREADFAFRLLLAHNPKLAPLAAAAGFDLQLSGHTHAGQFFPWTLAVRWLHAPHVAGLSRCDHTWIYVSAGTGTWGPPVRFGTEPELTILRLVRTGD